MRSTSASDAMSPAIATALRPCAFTASTTAAADAASRLVVHADIEAARRRELGGCRADAAPGAGNEKNWHQTPGLRRARLRLRPAMMLKASTEAAKAIAK